MSSRRVRCLALFALLALATVVRLWAVIWGLPRYDLGTDEGVTARLVQSLLLRNDLNTSYYRWPNLNVYLSLGAVKAAYRFAPALVSEPYGHHAVGRGVSALCGSLTLLFIYLATRRLLDPRTALAAAALHAFLPLALDRSRNWVSDAPMTMFYTLTLWLAARLLDRPTTARFALAAAAAGLATATKYNGAFACFLIFLAALGARGTATRGTGFGTGIRERGARLVLAAPIAVAVFFLCNPYAILDYPRFQHELGAGGELYTGEPPTGFLGYHGIRYILLSFFRSGMGPLPSVLAAIGLVLLAWRHTARTLLVWLPPLVYLVLYNTTLRFPLPRNALLLLPHLAIAAAAALLALGDVLDRWGRRRHPGLALGRPLTIGVVLLAALPGLGETIAVRSGATRVEAEEWILAHVPPGAEIMSEFSMVELPRGLYAVRRTVSCLYDHPMEVLDAADYLVAVSESYAYVLGQRHRPGFAPRAAIYDAIFAGDRFDLAARFPADLTSGGPEVRVYRNRRPLAVTVDRGCTDVAPILQDNRRWRPLRRKEGMRLGGGAHLWAGSVVVPEDGRYELRIAVQARPRFPLEVGLGSRARRYLLSGDAAIVHGARIPAGRAWIRIKTGSGWNDLARCEIQSVELCSVDPREARARPLSSPVMGEGVSSPSEVGR